MGRGWGRVGGGVGGGAKWAVAAVVAAAVASIEGEGGEGGADNGRRQFGEGLRRVPYCLRVYYTTVQFSTAVMTMYRVQVCGRVLSGAACMHPASGGQVLRRVSASASTAMGRNVSDITLDSGRSSLLA